MPFVHSDSATEYLAKAAAIFESGITLDIMRKHQPATIDLAVEVSLADDNLTLVATTPATYGRNVRMPKQMRNDAQRLMAQGLQGVFGQSYADTTPTGISSIGNNQFVVDVAHYRGFRPVDVVTKLFGRFGNAITATEKQPGEIHVTIHHGIDQSCIASAMHLLLTT
jgi:hypothetical protein